MLKIYINEPVSILDMETIILLLLVSTFIASMFGSFTGFGISTVLIPIFLLFFPPPVTLLIVGIIHWFNNVWRITLFRKGMIYKLVLYFGAPGILLAYTGARLTVEVPHDIMTRAIGVIIILYVVFIYVKEDFEVKANKKNALLGGSMYGFSSGISGIGGEIRTMFLLAYKLPKSVYIATTGAISIIIDSTRIITYVWGGARLESALIYAAPLLIATTLGGAYVGKNIVEKLPKERFRQVVGIFLLAVAVKMIVWP